MTLLAKRAYRLAMVALLPPVLAACQCETAAPQPGFNATGAFEGHYTSTDGGPFSSLDLSHEASAYRGSLVSSGVNFGARAVQSGATLAVAWSPNGTEGVGLYQLGGDAVGRLSDRSGSKTWEKWFDIGRSDGVAGTYSVSSVNEDTGEKLRGSVKVTKTARDVFQVVWTFDDRPLRRGVAIRHDDALAVGFGTNDVGVAAFEKEEAGNENKSVAQMTGHWARLGSTKRPLTINHQDKSRTKLGAP